MLNKGLVRSIILDEKIKCTLLEAKFQIIDLNRILNILANVLSLISIIRFLQILQIQFSLEIKLELCRALITYMFLEVLARVMDLNQLMNQDYTVGTCVLYTLSNVLTYNTKAKVLKLSKSKTAAFDNFLLPFLSQIMEKS